MILPVERIVLVDTTKILPLGDDFDRDVGAAGPQTMRTVFSDGAAIIAQPQQSFFVPSNASVQSFAGTAVVLGPGDRCFVQNLGVNPLFVKYGLGASASDFHEELNPGSVVDDGIGGSGYIERVLGPISVGGATPRYMIWKLLV